MQVQYRERKSNGRFDGRSMLDGFPSFLHMTATAGAGGEKDVMFQDPRNSQTSLPNAWIRKRYMHKHTQISGVSLMYQYEVHSTLAQ
jgi:hypothetical protein